MNQYRYCMFIDKLYLRSFNLKLIIFVLTMIINESFLGVLKFRCQQACTTSIGKIVNLHNVSYYRSISMCNVSYKIISTIVTKKLIRASHKCHPGFFQSRNINDNMKF